MIKIVNNISVNLFVCTCRTKHRTVIATRLFWFDINTSIKKYKLRKKQQLINIISFYVYLRIYRNSNTTEMDSRLNLDVDFNLK